MKKNSCFSLKRSLILLVVGLGPFSIARAGDISPLFGIGQEDMEITISDIRGDKNNIKLQPNITGISRLALSAYGFTVGASIRDTKELDPAYGKTTFFDAQVDYHNRKWGVDAFYQTYKGFYTTEMPQTQLYPELKFEHYGLMGRYALEESDFSVAALMNQADEIRSTAGKYYLVGGFRHHVMENDTSLLLQNYVGSNSDLENLRKMKVSSLNLGVGAGKWWVNSSHFFIGAIFDLIGTYGLYKYEDASAITTNSSYATLSYDVKLGFGYAGEVWKYGISVSNDVTTLKTPGSSIIQSQALKALLYLRLTIK